jgi:CubicO group peptidase (beta-lactamase class C family)
VDRAVRDGIAAGIFPGAVVVVGTNDRVLYAAGHGHFTWSEDSPVPDPDSTLYDLASLTKVVATTSAIMLLADRGRVALRHPVSAYLPAFDGPGKDRVTVRHLLEHRSGLRAFLPLNERAADAGEARTLVLTEPLQWDPGTRVEYSDLNAMILGWVADEAAGEPFDRLVARELFAPLSMTETRVRPPRALRSRIAPVGLWRGHAIAGELHDQNAVRLGGVSGHAGLYATGRDLARFAQFMLREGRDPTGQQLVRTGTVRLFTRRGPGNRALGWESRDTTTSDNAGSRFSADAYGHTGYTGTSLWIDPRQDLFVVILTNRVFAPRTRRSISGLKRVRGEVADAAVGLVTRCRAGASAGDVSAGC